MKEVDFWVDLCDFLGRVFFRYFLMGVFCLVEGLSCVIKLGVMLDGCFLKIEVERVVNWFFFFLGRWILRKLFFFWGKCGFFLIGLMVVVLKIWLDCILLLVVLGDLKILDCVLIWLVLDELFVEIWLCLMWILVLCMVLYVLEFIWVLSFCWCF